MALWYYVVDGAKIIRRKRVELFRLQCSTDMMRGWSVFGCVDNRFVYWVCGVAFVFYISNIAVHVVGVVSHNLCAAIG